MNIKKALKIAGIVAGGIVIIAGGITLAAKLISKKRRNDIAECECCCEEDLTDDCCDCGEATA